MEEYQVTLNDISRKAGLLASRYNELKGEYAFLEERNKELLEENKLLREQIWEEQSRSESVENELGTIKLTKAFVPRSEQEKTEMKRKVNEFIKEIDRCVAMLND